NTRGIRVEHFRVARGFFYTFGGVSCHDAGVTGDWELKVIIKIITSFHQSRNHKNNRFLFN
ncbi:hypothetical protein J4V10_09725, partial [Escherichia coli]